MDGEGYGGQRLARSVRVKPSSDEVANFSSDD